MKSTSKVLLGASSAFYVLTSPVEAGGPTPTHDLNLSHFVATRSTAGPDLAVVETATTRSQPVNSPTSSPHPPELQENNVTTLNLSKKFSGARRRQLDCSIPGILPNLREVVLSYLSPSLRYCQKKLSQLPKRGLIAVDLSDCFLGDGVVTILVNTFWRFFDPDSQSSPSERRPLIFTCLDLSGNNLTGANLHSFFSPPNGRVKINELRLHNNPFESQAMRGLIVLSNAATLSLEGRNLTQEDLMTVIESTLLCRGLPHRTPLQSTVLQSLLVYNVSPLIVEQVIKRGSRSHIPITFKTSSGVEDRYLPPSTRVMVSRPSRWGSGSVWYFAS